MRRVSAQHKRCRKPICPCEDYCERIEGKDAIVTICWAYYKLMGYEMKEAEAR